MKFESVEDLFTQSGCLNSAKIRRSEFKQSELYNSIYKCSQFLPDDCKLLERIYAFKYQINNFPICVICKGKCHFNPYSSKFGSYSNTCSSRKCISKSTAEKRIDTMIEKYGALVSDKHISKNKKAVDNFIKKGKQTLLDRYGVTNVSHLPGIAEKKKNTLIKNFGVDHPSKIANNKEAAHRSSIIFYESLCKSVKVTGLSEPLVVCKMVNFTCMTCNKEESLPTETFKWRCRKIVTPCSACSGVNIGSAFQQSITSFITSIYSGRVIVNDRKTLPSTKELDIYLPDINLAIEANGVFWHSCNNLEDDSNFKNYHLNKTKECEKLGIRLIHIFEDHWITNTDLVKSRITSLIRPNKIFARKCKLLAVSPKEERSFLISNHIQGYVPSAYRLGLFFNDKLVALMSFGKTRFQKSEDTMELLRFCSAQNTQVIGGASRLLKSAILMFNIQKIVSYSDRSWGIGDLYAKLKFTKVSESSPSYRWINNMKSLSRFQTQKHKLPQLLGSQYNANMTEAQNMFSAGWRRIWDCGTTKWVLAP